VRTFSIGFPVREFDERITPGRRPSGSARSTRSSRCGPTRWRCCPGSCGITMSPLPTARRCRRGTFATDPAARHGGAHRRRRRRTVRRLPALSGRMVGRGVRPVAEPDAADLCGGYWQRFPRARGRSRSCGDGSGLSRCWASRRRGGIWSGSPFSARPAAGSFTARTLRRAWEKCPPLQWGGVRWQPECSGCFLGLPHRGLGPL